MRLWLVLFEHHLIYSTASLTALGSGYYNCPMSQGTIKQRPKLNFLSLKDALLQVYCPLCEECYSPRSKYHDSIDGAFFGTTFPHLLLMTYPQLQAEAPAEPYVPRVFGFKLSSAAPGRSQGSLASSNRRQPVRPAVLAMLHVMSNVQ